MRLRAPGYAQIAQVASHYRKATISARAVHAQLARLAGVLKQGNGRLGPVGFALVALANPVGGVAASILLALDQLRVLATPAPHEPFHDPERHFLAGVAAALRRGQLAEIEAEAGRLRLLYEADPQRLGRLPSDWATSDGAVPTTPSR